MRPEGSDEEPGVKGYLRPHSSSHYRQKYEHIASFKKNEVVFIPV